LIADSPYQSGELILHPVAGLVGGMIGAGWMLAFIALGESFTHIAVMDVLNVMGAIGRAVSPFIACGLYVMLGGVFGLLYALSEQRGPPRDLVFVGLFYGVMLWALGAIVAASFMSEAARSTLRSASFFLGCLAYGLWLALLAIWSERGRPAMAGPMPKD